jgi:hypothetical protein
VKAAGRTLNYAELVQEAAGSNEPLTVYVRVASAECPGVDLLRTGMTRTDEIVVSVSSVERRSNHLVLDVANDLSDHFAAFERLLTFVEGVSEKKTKGKPTALAENALGLLDQLGF